MQPQLSLLAVLALLVFRAMAAAIARSDIEIDGPYSTGINCPTTYTWTEGVAPFTATFSNIDTGGLSVPVESYAGLSDPSLTWLPQNNATGQMLRLTVSDAEGDEGEFQIIIVSTQVVCD